VVLFVVTVGIEQIRCLEAIELEISEEQSLCSAHGIGYRSFPIRDRGVPESFALFFALADMQPRSNKCLVRTHAKPRTAQAWRWFHSKEILCRTF
jgi:hypothetical protein